MKILEQVQSIFGKYELNKIVLPDGQRNVYQYLREFPIFVNNFETEKDDIFFLKKYVKHVPPGWYGFSIGSPIVPEWCEIIDEILELCVKTDPDFEIHQIKIKFGGIRFYVSSNIIEDIFEVERMIESTLFDEALIF